MKIICGIAGLLAHAALWAAEAFPVHTLETANHRVDITPRCAEGEVTCDRVDYRGVNRKTGAAIALRGETVHTLCADGVTPCRFLGYRFRHGKFIYHVWDAGDAEKGVLEVKKDGKVVLTEPGTWK